MQSSWATQLNPLLENPILKGSILSNVKLEIGTNEVPHKLNRKLTGWIIIRKRGASDIYDLQDQEIRPTQFLKLNSSASCQVDIYVF